MDSDPTFRKTNKDEIIHEFAMPLIAGREDGGKFVSGTAFVIGRGWGLTAYHVFEDYLRKYEGKVRESPNSSVSFGLQAFLTVDKGQRQVPLRVTQVWRTAPLDLAVLALEVPGDWPANHIWKLPMLSLLPPRKGTQIAAFGFADTQFDHLPDQSPALRLRPRTATGQVMEVHHQIRDSVQLPFPCFRTNARFDAGMSGGPVINNDTGEICGVICSSIPATRDNEDHLSYASSLWPLLATQVWPKLPDSSGTEPYRMIRLFRSGVCNASDIDKVFVEELPHDATRIRVGTNYSTVLWDGT